MVREGESTALSPLPLIFSYKSEKSLCGTGLDVFDDWWLSAGPLTLYIIWGFLDAFIQNYVSVQR